MRKAQSTTLAALLGLCLLLSAVLLPAAPARAAGDDLQLNLCKQVLARMLCKKANELNYVGKLEESVYILSVFYASKNSEYLCAVLGDGQVILQDRTWRAMRRVFHYEPDSSGKCLVANYSNPECPVKAPAKSCPPKLDAKEQAKETFWNRPIPKILEEEFKAMKAPGEGNATAPATVVPEPAPAPAK